MYRSKEIIAWAMKNPWEQTGENEARCRVTGKTYPAIWHDGQMMALEADAEQAAELEALGVLPKEVKLYGLATSIFDV